MDLFFFYFFHELALMPKEFDINMLRCIYCGFCQEVCPEEAIYLLKDYAITGGSLWMSKALKRMRSGQARKDYWVENEI